MMLLTGLSSFQVLPDKRLQICVSPSCCICVCPHE